MRYLVLGTGLVGHALGALLDERGAPHVLVPRTEIEARGGIAAAGEGLVLRGDVVVNAAAFTSVDACEDHVEEAMRVNGEEPGRLARVCRDRAARLVHLSTDAVLDVTNVYARSKALGEERVRAEGGEDPLILRLSTVFGPHPKKEDFVRFVVRRLREGAEVRAITDMICSPTYTRDAARAIVAAVEGGARGTHAFVNEPSISRHAFATLIADVWRVTGSIQGVRMDEFTGFKAKRPRDTSMHPTLGAWHRPMPLRAALEDYRARWP